VASGSRDEVEIAGDFVEAGPGAGPADASNAASRLTQSLDSAFWRATTRPPFQFLRWLGALCTVTVEWALSAGHANASSYLPVVLIAGLLLLPDAKSITLPGLKFERLTDEVTRQREEVARLAQDVKLMNCSLMANSQQVIIRLGVESAIAAKVALGEDSDRLPVSAVDKFITADLLASGAYAERLPDVVLGRDLDQPAADDIDRWQ
jgi:hypothetical protein